MEFDVDEFRAIYPQFAETSETALDFYWQNALLISGLADDTRYTEQERKNLLYMLVCHLATLAARGTAGSMTSAKQGEVQANYSTLATIGSDDWYNLTPCGAAYYQAVKRGRYGGIWFAGSDTM
jgi:hypothetical protein